LRSTLFELRGVSYTYTNGTVALENVTFKIFEGENVAILGPNGGGKSTLLMIMDGLLEPTEGEVYFRGRKVDPKDEKFMFEMRKRVGMVFQDPDVALFSSTVWEDIIFGPLHMRLPREEVIRRGEWALRTLGIEHLKDRPPFQLSEGEKKKAAIASVLSIDPEVLLLDEPFINLDLRSQERLLALLREMSRSGKTLILATHDVNIVPLLADRVILLNKTVIADGSVREIFSRPELLKSANIRPPLVAVLFTELMKRNLVGDGVRVPLTVEEAVSAIVKMFDSKDKITKRSSPGRFSGLQDDSEH